MSVLGDVRAELHKHAGLKKAGYLPQFFRAVPGGYGEGDQFIGVAVPVQRTVAKKFYKEINMEELTELLSDPIHEHRQTALFMMVYRFEKADSVGKKALVDMYLENLDFVNNWDLVDASAEKILGAHLFDKDRAILYKLAGTKRLWRERVAIIATFYFIRKGQYEDTLRIAEVLLHHPHDLIHKAVGWMLREVGNRDLETEMHFLKKHYQQMPRTMLRYAIEKFEPEVREAFLKGRV